MMDGSLMSESWQCGLACRNNDSSSSEDWHLTNVHNLCTRAIQHEAGIITACSNSRLSNLKCDHLSRNVAAAALDQC